MRQVLVGLRVTTGDTTTGVLNGFIDRRRVDIYERLAALRSSGFPDPLLGSCLTSLSRGGLDDQASQHDASYGVATTVSNS